MIENQRADFEAYIVKHYADMDIVPDLTRGRLEPYNYEDSEINTQWWGFQAGQSALADRLLSDLGTVTPPASTRGARIHWIHGAQTVLNVVNRILGAEG